MRLGRGDGKGVSLVYDLGILSGIQVPLVLDYAYYTLHDDSADLHETFVGN